MNARSDLFRMFERAGFTLVRCTNHAVWRCPCGHTIVVSPSSPGEGRAGPNAQAQIARTLRSCGKPSTTRRRT